MSLTTFALSQGPKQATASTILLTGKLIMKNTFPLALTFLTKMPWPRALMAEAQDLARAMFWFPWVGALLGLAFLGAWTGLTRVLPATRPPRRCWWPSPSWSPAASTWTAWPIPLTAWAAARPRKSAAAS